MQRLLPRVLANRLILSVRPCCVSTRQRQDRASSSIQRGQCCFRRLLLLFKPETAEEKEANAQKAPQIWGKGVIVLPLYVLHYIFSSPCHNCLQNLWSEKKNSLRAELERIQEVSLSPQAVLEGPLGARSKAGSSAKPD